MASLPSGRGIKIIETLRMLWHLPTLVRLLGRLLRDARVQAGPKLFLFAALAFIVSPLDVPNWVPVLGELSDVMLALFACRWFISLCPAEAVSEHLASVRQSAAATAPAFLLPAVEATR